MNRFKTFTQTLRLSIAMAFLFCSVALTAQTIFNISQIQDVIRQQDDLRLSPNDYADISITSQYYDAKANVTHVYVQQNHRGIPVVEGTMGLHFSDTDELVYFTSNFLTHIEAKANSLTPAVKASTAVENALAQIGIDASNLTVKEVRSPSEFIFNKKKYSIYDIPARLIYDLDERGQLSLAWEVRIYPIHEQNYWVMAMDAASGRELDRTDLVVHCTFEAPEHRHNTSCTQKTRQKANTQVAIPSSTFGFSEKTNGGTNFYRVYDAFIEAPSFGDRTMVGTGGDAASSPLGWHDDGLVEYNITKGNNVYAYQDPGPGSTGIPAVGGTPGQQPLVFDFEANLNLTPANYRDAAITNLFYWNNLIHDVFYQYGFVESAGNFQTTNFANGGEGMDAVLAEAQDGSGVNNANFLTLADGLPGRMQMFLWASVPVIDGDFDNGVILHEYGHGISTRLTGGPAATCLGGDEQSGEGWSDFFGYMLTMDPASVPGIFATGRGIGTYVLGEGPGGDGIRPARYSTDFAVNDYTYGDLTRAGIAAPHGVGFIWSTMLWEMTAKLVEVYGYDADITYGNGGNNMAIQLVMTGLTLQPCSPTFIQQRDAILAADQLLYGGANRCLIWEAFAKRGLGFSAQAGTNGVGDEIPAFDMPPSFCQPTVTMESEVQSLTHNGGSLEVNVFVTNNSSGPISGVDVLEKMPAGFTFAGASHAASVQGQNVRFSNLTIPANSTETIQITLTANTASNAVMQARDDMESDPFGWSASPGVDQFVWSTQRAFSGNYAWFCTNPNNFGNQLLTWNQVITPVSGTELRFAHYFNTEVGFDGGVVEVSNDDGTTWTDAGPLFVQNGYNSIVAPADNPLINGFCFGGESGGFIHSRINLSPFAGQTIKVRFRFASDVLTAAEGWYIDDMEVVNNPFLVNNETSFSMANGFVTGSSTVEVLVLGQPANLQAATPGFTTDFEIAEQVAPHTLELKMSPNPATGIVQLQLHSNDQTPAQIRVMNAQGLVMFQEANLQLTSNNQLQLNIANWPAGIYITQLVQAGEQISQKLIVK